MKSQDNELVNEIYQLTSRLPNICQTLYGVKKCNNICWIPYGHMRQVSVTLAFLAIFSGASLRSPRRTGKTKMSCHAIPKSGFTVLCSRGSSVNQTTLNEVLWSCKVKRANLLFEKSVSMVTKFSNSRIPAPITNSLL